MDVPLDHKKTFSIKEALSTAWGIFWSRPWFFIGITLFVQLLNFVPQVVGLFTESLIVTIAVALIATSMVIWASLGAYFIILQSARGNVHNLTFSDLFSQGHLFWKFIGASLLYGLIVFGGLVLFVIPGIIWSFMFLFYYLVLLDHHDLGIRSILRESRKITQGAKWKLFVFMLASSGVILLGLLALGVGVLIANPIVMIAVALVYDRLRTQTPDTLEVASLALPEPSQEKRKMTRRAVVITVILSVGIAIAVMVGAGQQIAFLSSLERLDVSKILVAVEDDVDQQLILDNDDSIIKNNKDLSSLFESYRDLNWTRYQSADNGFEAGFPTLPDAYSFPGFFSDTEVPVIFLSARDREGEEEYSLYIENRVKEGNTLIKEIKLGADVLAYFQGTEVYTLEPVEFLGEDAYFVEFDYDGYGQKGQGYYVAHNGFVYFIVYSAKRMSEDNFETYIKMFQFLN